MRFRILLGGIAWGLIGMVARPAAAELSACVATVGFDEEANLERGMGVGLRWGKAGGLFGGETSLLVARPERRLAVGDEVSEETATAFFYEGRFLVNLPVGRIRPFLGVGFGAVTVTETKVRAPIGADQAIVQALETVAGLQTSTSVSYGAGVRYALADRLDLRLDLRQYLVFSVRGMAADRVRQRLEERVGMPSSDRLDKDYSVQYDELSLGVSLKF